MKNIYKIFILLIVLGSINTLSAIPRHVVSRHKTGCFPGCNTVHERSTRVTYHPAIGDPYEVDQVKISCSGIGLLSCPRTIAPENYTPALNLSLFDIANGNVMLAHAINQISGGTLNGTHTTTVINTADNTTWTYVVVWTTNAAGEEIINVTTEEI